MSGGFRQLIRDGIKSYHVWPVAFLAFFLGPSLAVFQSFHQISGPDVRVTKNFDTNQAFEKKKFKYISSVDYENYEHPRPKF